MATARWVAVGCTHGLFIDPHFRREFLSWVENYAPDVRIHLGDNWDFECLRGGASDQEQQDGLAEDIEAGNRFLSDYFAAGKTKVLLRGNHCERLWKMCSHANGVRREYAQEIARKLEQHVASLGASMRPYHVKRGVVRMGNLAFLHGISFALNCGQIHANAYAESGGTVVFVHSHAAGVGGVQKHPRPMTWINAGCGRTLCPEYAERRIATLRWEHAWAYGEIFDDGTSTAHLHKLNTPIEDQTCTTLSPFSPMPCAPDQTAHLVG